MPAASPRAAGARSRLFVGFANGRPGSSLGTGRDDRPPAGRGTSSTRRISCVVNSRSQRYWLSWCARPACRPQPGARRSNRRRAQHGRPAQITNLVVIYQENHSFDNLFGSWGKVGGQQVDGLAGSHRPARHAGRAGRHRLRLPAAGRRQPGGATTAELVPRPRAQRAEQQLRERSVQHRRLHRPGRHHLPGAGCLRAERGAEGSGRARRLHP